MGIRARRELGLKTLVGHAVVEAGHALTFLDRRVFQLHQHLRKIPVGCRAAYQVHVRSLLENLLALLLRHAAQDAEFLALLPQLLVVV